MSPKQYEPAMSFESQKQWGKWLREHHRKSNGLWLKFAKKAAAIDSVSHPQALEVAISYGWIDGQTASFDDKFWLQRFAPRRPRSKWSKINRMKAAELIEQGRMKPAGLKEIDLAKQDGRWDDAYDSQHNATVPPDLQKELEKNPRALKFFATLDSKNRYAILHRIHDAKKPETRERRIAKFISMLNEGKKIH